MTDRLQAIAPTIRTSKFNSYSRDVRNHIVAHERRVSLKESAERLRLELPEAEHLTRSRGQLTRGAPTPRTARHLGKPGSIPERCAPSFTVSSKMRCSTDGWPATGPTQPTRHRRWLRRVRMPRRFAASSTSREQRTIVCTHCG
jgi:hypothetical protein